ncbi:MAG: hypothetical protein LBJ12_06840 [Oscillospiraceae bacterium]|jgi:hypothetical protein|nr:hypothetical protein [Oscillospiraceae bacterium]
MMLDKIPTKTELEIAGVKLSKVTTSDEKGKNVSLISIKMREQTAILKSRFL